MDHHQHSDSDNVGIGESEDDDDSAVNDVRYDEDEMMFHPEDGPNYCIVSKAGNTAVNGQYYRDGEHEGSIRYSKSGHHDGRDALYSIFKCNVSNYTKHWYISVVPTQGEPGTSADIDFYSAPTGVDDSDGLPPKLGWVKCNALGMDPPPVIDFRDSGTDQNPII